MLPIVLIAFDIAADSSMSDERVHLYHVDGNHNNWKIKMENIIKVVETDSIVRIDPN